MWTICRYLLLPICLFGEILEVSLPTRMSKPSLYLTQLHVPSSAFDWRYFDELRQVLESDLESQGSISLVGMNSSLEEKFIWPDVRGSFDLNLWKKNQISYVLTIQVVDNRFQLIVFDIGKASSKKYSEFTLTGSLEKDRRAIHRLSDEVHKDLFGVQGISSLQILYSKRSKVEDGWNSEIWICDFDGANNRPVITDKGYCMSPGFFPGGDLFYYVSFQDGQSKIYKSSLSQRSSEQMISLRGSQALPAINKKGDQMAFITDVAGRPDLFIQNLDGRGKMVGKARQLFSMPRSTQASPTYSPDGKQIAFVSDKDGSPRIYVIDVIGPKDTKRPVARLLTKVNRENTSPSWSPDGTKLAYSAKVDGVRQIWVYDFALQEERAITSGMLNKENPSWAPDNLHLVYNTETEDDCELYRVHMIHKKPIQISKGPDQKRFAAWGF
jgi:TolB protein